MGNLIHLHVPLPTLLPVLEDIRPHQTFLGAYSLEHGEDTRHHAFEAAEVHVRTSVHAVENFVRVLLDLVLYVHLAARLVGLLAGKSVVEQVCPPRTNVGGMTYREQFRYRWQP